MLGHKYVETYIDASDSFPPPLLEEMFKFGLHTAITEAN